MSTYGARPEVIAIPVDEYKELLAANTELKIIYHKLESSFSPYSFSGIRLTSRHNPDLVRTPARPRNRFRMGANGHI